MDMHRAFTACWVYVEWVIWEWSYKLSQSHGILYAAIPHIVGVDDAIIVVSFTLH